MFTMKGMFPRVGRILAAATLAAIGASCGGASKTDTKPAAPTMLTAEALSGGAHLTWKDNSDNEEMFMINRKVGAGAYAQLTTVTFNTAQFHDAPLTSGTTYTYQVMAMKGEMVSDPSNEVVFTAP